MRRVLALALALFAGSAAALPLDSWPTWSVAQPYVSKRVAPASLVARGIGTNEYYVLEVDPATGEIPVSGSFSATISNDTNYGTVGSNTLRGAAQIGNATGAASFGAGTTGAQTLRVVLPTDQSSIPVTESGTWNITNVSGTVSLPTGASTAAKQPALGTAGAASADVISVQGIASGTALAVSAASLPLPTGAATSAAQTTAQTSLTTIAAGTPALGQAAMAASSPVVISSNQSAIPISNFPTTVDTSTGAAGASTLRTVIASRSESASTPLSVRISDGTSFSSPSQAGRAYADSARNDYTATNVTTGAWVQLIASTAATINALILFDSCGQTLELGVGGAGSETRKLIIPPGGHNGVVPLAIPSGSRVSVRAISASCTVGEINFTGLQ